MSGGIMTWNLARADAQAWAARRARVLAVLAREAPDLLCVQEAMPHQIADLAAWMPRHHCIAGEPDARGERNAVFALADRYDVLGHGTGPLPGNGTPRAATWTRLLDKREGARMTVVNAHLDHEAMDARVAAAEKLRALFPDAVLAGDMNAEPGSPAHRILLEDRWDPFPMEGAETMRGGGDLQADARYDHILLPRDVDAAATRVVRSDASDHHALVVDPTADPTADAEAAETDGVRSARRRP